MKCVVARIEPSATTFFQALMPDNACNVEAGDSGIGLNAIVRFVTEWLYLVGTGPSAQTPQGINFQATGSKLVMQKIVTVSRGVTTTVYRCICRELGAGSTASITWGTTTISLLAGQYIDCAIVSTGSNNTFGPYDFDDNSPPAGSSTLIATIETERVARGLA